MNILLGLLDGLMAFVSPCILPMLPIYVMYFAGDGQGSLKKRLINTLGFILGFTVIFVAMGAAASSLGSLLIKNQRLLTRLSGAVIIVFGLNYLGVLKFTLGGGSVKADVKNLTFAKSLVFGMAFTFGWTPCLTAFLGSALMLASRSETLFEGMLLLFCFSMGLAIPFLLTSLALRQATALFAFLKRNMRVIKIVSGVVLIAIGALMLFDLFGYYASFFDIT